MEKTLSDSAEEAELGAGRLREEEECRSYPSSRRQALLREGQEGDTSLFIFSWRVDAVEQGSSSAKRSSSAESEIPCKLESFNTIYHIIVVRFIVFIITHGKGMRKFC